MGLGGPAADWMRRARLSRDHAGGAMVGAVTFPGPGTLSARPTRPDVMGPHEETKQAGKGRGALSGASEVVAGAGFEPATFGL